MIQLIPSLLTALVLICAGAWLSLAGSCAAALPREFYSNGSDTRGLSEIQVRLIAIGMALLGIVLFVAGLLLAMSDPA